MTRIKKSRQNSRREERKPNSNRFKEEMNLENKLNKRPRENRKLKK